MPPPAHPPSRPGSARKTPKQHRHPLSPLGAKHHHPQLPAGNGAGGSGQPALPALPDGRAVAGATRDDLPHQGPWIDSLCDRIVELMICRTGPCDCQKAAGRVSVPAWPREHEHGACERPMSPAGGPPVAQSPRPPVSGLSRCQRRRHTLGSLPQSPLHCSPEPGQFRILGPRGGRVSPGPAMLHTLSTAPETCQANRLTRMNCQQAVLARRPFGVCFLRLGVEQCVTDVILPCASQADPTIDVLRHRN